MVRHFIKWESEKEVFSNKISYNGERGILNSPLEGEDGRRYFDTSIIEYSVSTVDDYLHYPKYFLKQLLKFPFKIDNPNYEPTSWAIISLKSITEVAPENSVLVDDVFDTIKTRLGDTVFNMVKSAAESELGDFVRKGLIPAFNENFLVTVKGYYPEYELVYPKFVSLREAKRIIGFLEQSSDHRNLDLALKGFTTKDKFINDYDL